MPLKMTFKFYSTLRFLTTSAVSLSLLLAFLESSAYAQNVSFSGDYFGVRNPHSDPTQPVSSGRSYFTTEVTELPDNKVKLSVDLWHGNLDAPVALNLKVAINDGSGQLASIPFMELQKAVADNPTLYLSKREFVFSYQELNEALQKALPGPVQHIKIEPGTPLFLHAYWPKYNHTWGDIGRGGIFYLPESKTATGTKKLVTTKTRAAAELDLAYPITSLLAFRYSHMENGVRKGLKEKGQIKSRLEMEGKYQVPLADADELLKKLFALANDPKLASQVLGADWSIQAEMRYMKKDAQGNLLKDKNGMPIPDPMVDTYYDSVESRGAQNDVALRYRWTEQNATGSWNFKPGMTHSTADGIVSRLEYAVDTTDDKPETVKRFADSMDPLNPFRAIRDLVPGAKPSDFLFPSVKLDDTRYKFKIKEKSGLVVEVSLDQVTASSLRNGKKARFVQLEMDVDHPSTASNNLASAVVKIATFGALVDPADLDLLKTMDAKAFLDGRPVMHTIEDLEKTSAVNTKHGADFSRAEQMIVRLRDHALGANWLAAPQKASLAALLLDHVQRKDMSKSVRNMFSQVRKRGGQKKLGRLFSNEVSEGISGAPSCRRIMLAK